MLQPLLQHEKALVGWVMLFSVAVIWCGTLIWCDLFVATSQRSRSVYWSLPCTIDVSWYKGWLHMESRYAEGGFTGCFDETVKYCFSQFAFATCIKCVHFFILYFFPVMYEMSSDPMFWRNTKIQFCPIPKRHLYKSSYLPFSFQGIN